MQFLKFSGEVEKLGKTELVFSRGGVGQEGPILHTFSLSTPIIHAFHFFGGFDKKKLTILKVSVFYFK